MTTLKEVVAGAVATEVAQARAVRVLIRTMMAL